jgi:hypothetical protein
MQTVLITTVVALGLGALVAMLLKRTRPDDAPPPIADPYGELYSEQSGEVIAHPFGEPHGSVGSEELGEDGPPPAATEPDTLEFAPAQPLARHFANRGDSADSDGRV